MKQIKINKKITALLLLSLAIILIATGCGKTGASTLDLNDYTSGSSSIPGNENETGNTNSANDTDENENQTTSYSEPGIIDTVTLSWSPPSVNADGYPLAGDLAGYIIHYGQDTDNYTDSVDIGEFTTASVSDLTYGTWCFTVTAYDSVGNESDFSEEICKTIS